MGLSLRAYARHRADLGLPGGSLQAVQRARDRGRITLEPDGSVDPVRADREWAENTDLSEAPVAVVEAHARAIPAETPPRAEGSSRHLQAPSTTPPPEPAPPVARLTSTLTENNAVKVYWQARKAELEFREAAGELVPAAGVRAELEDVFRKCRTKLLGVPSRAKQAMPELTTAQIAKFEGLIRESLEDLAAGQF
ncbi:hypothetical protein [Hyalangium gracile]|uniref:hypothetical protein n=1 Tax=Hyalangium gracile TaxID=394092 RepID=UPI001CCB9B09|nr:hypothetical protein [Hyalangium gracile]